MHTAVVEFDALADAVRAAAKDHDLLLVGRIGLALVLVGRVHVGGIGREFSGTGIDTLVHRTHTKCMTTISEFGFSRLEQISRATVGKALALEIAQLFCGQRGKIAFFHFQLEIDDLLDLNEEPRINLGQLKYLLNRHPDTESIGDVPQAIRRWPGQLFIDSFRIH